MTFKSPLVPTILGVALLTTSSVSADAIPLAPVTQPSTSGLSIIYDPATGNLSATAPDGTSLAALKLESRSELFSEDSCQGLGGPFDLCRPEEVFKLAADGFESVDFGEILSPGIGWKALKEDLQVDGASVGGGFEVGDGPWIVHSAVPEPTSAFALVCGFGLLIASLRRRMQT